MRKDWKRAGVLIIHVGILLMIVGGGVQYAFATDGHMTLYEGETAAVYESYYIWEIAIAEANAGGEVQEHLIPGDQIKSLGEGESRTFTSPDLPFDLVVHDYMRNCQPMPKGPMFQVDMPVVDGLFLQRMDPAPQAEANIAGFYATAVDKETGEETTDIVWGKSWWRNIVPMTVESGGKTWAIELRKKRYDVPFSVKLDDFTRELHPGTAMAASFSSDVTKTQNGTDQHIHIAMNQPLRHQGYTFYQASWGPEDAKPGEPLFSTFAVVKNPADKFPLWACVIISIGLVYHFCLKLYGYLRAESRRAAS